MKRVLSLIVLCLSIFCFCACEKNTDALKFKEEYESINGEVGKNNTENRSINIDKDNPFIYSTAEEIVSKINNQESFVVYFGFNTCPWCRSVLPTLVEVSKDLDNDKIYYVDVKDIRDVMVLNEDGKLITETEGTDAYYELTNLLRDVLSDYVIYDEEGNSVLTGAKRIYAPNVVKVEDGKALLMVDGVSDKQTDPFMELTDEILEDSYNEFQELLGN